MTITKYLKGHAGLVTFIALIVVVIAVIGGRAATKKPAEESASNSKQVSLVAAGSFRDDLSTVSVDGIVASASQVDIKSQVSAPIAYISVTTGSTVTAGQVIMEFQNADIRAQLEQARANLVLATGKTSGSLPVDIARKTATDQIRENYSRTNDVVNGQLGQFLFNSNTNTPQLQTYITDLHITDQLRAQWLEAVDAVDAWRKSSATLSATSSQEDIDAGILLAEKSLSTVSKFLDTLSNALVNVTRSADQSTLATIEGWKASATAARSSINASISTLTNTSSSLVTNQAQISVASAGVKNLEAQLAKTVITAPISGTISALPLKVGEFVSMGQLVTTVVGSGGLEITAYASGDDLERIKKGALVTVEGNIPGVVESVAPNVSQITKKVEVKILVPAVERSNLVVGENVQAKIKTTTPLTSNRVPVYVLPIQNIKIIPGAAYVYTVDADSKIVKNEVKLSDVKGDFVEVTSGLTDDMNIVSPVYELEEGEVVRTEK